MVRVVKISIRVKAELLGLTTGPSPWMERGGRIVFFFLGMERGDFGDLDCWGWSWDFAKDLSLSLSLSRPAVLRK
jgi:hypothetical protein